MQNQAVKWFANHSTAWLDEYILSSKSNITIFYWIHTKAC